MLRKIPIKYRLPIVLAALLIPLAFVGGINSLSEGYQSTPSSNITINAASRSDYCRKINNTSGNTYFVPTNTAGEWGAFLSNLPPSTSAAQCCDAGQCWNGSSCVTANSDGDAQNTTACLSINNGGTDCRDDLASVYSGAAFTCNGYYDDDCSGGADWNASVPGKTPDSGDGATWIDSGTPARTYYSGTDCGGSVVAKEVYTSGWDADCNTAAYAGGGSIALNSSYFGIIGTCLNSSNIYNKVPSGAPSYNSRADNGVCAGNESLTIQTYRPAESLDGGYGANPPGGSCACAYYNGVWYCPPNSIP